MPACPKPVKTTPEQRKAERNGRERNPFKPVFGDHGERDIPADPLDHDRYKVEGSSLHAFSRKRLAEAQAKGQRLSSTWVAKPGRKRLERPRKSPTGAKVKWVAQRCGFSLKKGHPMKPIGIRGRRLRPGDRKQEAATHVLPCVCGCNAHLQTGADGVPGKGLVSRAHLESRAYEATRNDDANNYPGCLHLNHWLDHEPGGVKCKADLLTLTKEKAGRLLAEEIRPLLKLHGYYDWRATAWRI